MSRITKKFEAFGVQYRTTEFAAVEGLRIFGVKRDIHPTEFLSRTEVMNSATGKWELLNNRNSINLLVKDMAGIIAPRLVLRAISSLVNEFNFGFAEKWKGVKVPMRFQEDGKRVESVNIDPMVSTLTNAGVASLRELEEYYSLEDAFKLFDSVTMNGVNEALSQERAMSKTR